MVVLKKKKVWFFKKTIKEKEEKFLEKTEMCAKDND